MRIKTARGFTLVELLVVIAIIAILAAVVYLVINPIELQRSSRDSVRLGDLQQLNQAITAAAQEATGSGTTILCAPPATAPCSGDSATASQANNGTGWVKVDVSNQRTVSLPALPKDPVNAGNNVYRYQTNAAADAWEINGVLESNKNQTKMQGDGGNDPARFEIGSKLDII